MGAPSVAQLRAMKAEREKQQQQSLEPNSTATEKNVTTPTPTADAGTPAKNDDNQTTEESTSNGKLKHPTLKRPDMKHRKPSKKSNSLSDKVNQGQ